MRYVLRKTDLSDELELEISKESYEAYKESRTILSNCLEIEEKYEILTRIPCSLATGYPYCSKLYEWNIYIEKVTNHVVKRRTR